MRSCTLYAGYDMSYAYGTEPGTHYQLRNVAETHYRTEATPTAADRIHNTHSYSYDPNGNLAYVATGRRRSDGSSTPKMSERKLLWDAQNRLRALSDDGYVSLYWYDADGNRTVRERHGGEAVWVNSEPAGMESGAPRWTVTPGGFITFDGTDSYTEHVYIGDERVASIRRPFSTEYYADNVQHLAGVGLGSGVDYSVLISRMRTSAAGACDSLGVPWSSYTSGGNTRGGEPTIRHILMAPAAQDGDTTRPRTPQPDYSLDSVYYYHRDHLGGTMTVTDGAGAPVQQVEYTPWGEVFVELKGDSVLTTPFLFNGKELDEETGLYYYGARYYDPKMSVWYSTDPMEGKYPSLSSYCFSYNNPLRIIDPNGMDWEDCNGNKIEDHDKIRVYIFYDNIDFKKQTLAMYHEAESLYGKGSVALSDASTTNDFIDDWRDMKSNNIREVNLNYHGSNQGLYIDYRVKEYITATGDGLTNAKRGKIERHIAKNLQDLPNPIGDISKAQLNINSCRSNSKTQRKLLGNGKTLMQAFADRFKFQAIRGSSVGVSYGRFDLLPHPQYLAPEGKFKNWEFIGKPIKRPVVKQYNSVDALFFRTGGMK